MPRQTDYTDELASCKPISLSDLKEAIATIRASQVATEQVASQSEADELTAQDPAGHVWTVGEKYYEVLHGAPQ